MFTSHILLPDGAAKCGANVYRAWETNERKINTRKYIYFANPEKGEIANCKRCTNTVEKKSVNAPIDRNMIGVVFHRSFGYDMTINVFCKAIEQGEKSLLVQECGVNVVAGDPWGNRGDGRTTAGEIDKSAKPFRLFRKVYTGYDGSKSEYWTGAGESWRIDDGGSHYENHCD